MSGSVYFLQVGTDGPIKIGFTTQSVVSRMKIIQLGSPHQLRWIGFFAGTSADERHAHKLLQNSSLRGEWFYPTKEVLAFVAQKSPNFDPVSWENRLIFSWSHSEETKAKISASHLLNWQRKRSALPQ